VARYDQTTINLPEETKRKVRLLAAEMGISMGKAALRLIEIGLEDYKYQHKTIQPAYSQGESLGKPPVMRVQV
jgi:plasmid stability protein